MGEEGDGGTGEWGNRGMGDGGRGRERGAEEDIGKG